MVNSIEQLDVQILDFEIVPGLSKQRFKIELDEPKRQNKLFSMWNMEYVPFGV